MPSGQGRPGKSGSAALPEPAVPDLPADLTPAALPGDDLMDGGVCELLAYADLDLSGRQATGAEIDACRFADVNLSQAMLRRGLVRDVTFERCDLASFRALGSSFTRVAMSACRMTGVSVLDTNLRDLTVTGCRVDLSSFRASTFTHVVFTDCRMEQADFADADLRGARFAGCALTGAQFTGARMVGTRFAQCELTGISGVTSMRGAIIGSTDAVALAGILASALGITIDDDLPAR